MVFYYSDRIQFFSSHRSTREREREGGSLWTDTHFPLHRHPSPVASPKGSVDLSSVIYQCVPPTLEYGTRPFLRWIRSQGRSPHTSGKAKNTFGPVGIPLFGAPQAPGNKPNPPEGGKSLGGWPPEAEGNLQCWGTPGRTAQRLDGLPNATQELERKGHTQTP